MEKSKKIEEYIEKHSHWKAELYKIRCLLLKTDLNEEIKWSAPAYTFNGKILLGLGAYKNHLGIWFHQGVFLKDKHKKLHNAQEGKTKALRQWRFIKGDLIEEEIILDYANEAIANCIAGKEIKPERKKSKIVIPPILKNALENDSIFAENFTKLTPGKQREYATNISEAKREVTQLSRLEKSIILINQGKGLYDKYKNC